MFALFQRIFLRLLLCCAASYLLWRALGPVGLAVSSPIFAMAFARPIFDVLSGARRTAKRLALISVEGRYYSHRGQPIEVVEDVEHHRWLRLIDVRKLLQGLPQEAVLALQFPQRVQDRRIRADALRDYLSKSQEGDSLRFRNWLERELLSPTTRLRQRMGLPDVAREAKPAARAQGANEEKN